MQRFRDGGQAHIPSPPQVLDPKAEIEEASSRTQELTKSEEVLDEWEANVKNEEEN